MGKGFNNYMCKKFFHPASRDNLKRVWMAEQKSDSYKKKQEELRMQYEKEQDLYTNKAMLSKESKDKLSVNFMYEPPPGAKKEREREDNEPEYKFEWQRKFNAPREDYCKGDSEIRDQPFGIQVRNVRCIKCHKWGHINTDKECPMYNQSNSSQSLNNADPLVLIQQMREDGLTIKRGVLEAQQHLNVSRKDAQRDMIPTDDEADESITQNEKEFLKSLTKKQKLKLLRKLERMEERKGSKKSSDKKKKAKSKKKDKKSDKRNGRHATLSEDEEEEEEWVEDDGVSNDKPSRGDEKSQSSKSEERTKKNYWNRSLSVENDVEERDYGERDEKRKMEDKKERRKATHKNGKVSGGKHEHSRSSEDENSDDDRRGTSSRKTDKMYSRSSYSDRRAKKENGGKRKSSPGSDNDSGYGKRHRK